MSIFQYLKRRPPIFFVVAGTVITVMIAVPDYLLPWGVSFSIFYLIPVSFAAWYAGKGTGTYLALVSAGVWLAVDLLSRGSYANPYVPYWNALVRLGFFLIVVFLLNGLKLEKISAREDYLTGLGNRRNFFKLAEKEMRRSQRYGHFFSIAYIDVDDFKSINDRFGHHEGDLLLSSIAAVIQSSIRATDIAGRLGGDEFAVLLPESSAASAEKFFNKLHRKLGRITVHHLPVTFSIGVVTFLKLPSSEEEMIKTVDKLMYSAKKEGKNQVRYEVIRLPEGTERAA